MFDLLFYSNFAFQKKFFLLKERNAHMRVCMRVCVYACMCVCICMYPDPDPEPEPESRPESRPEARFRPGRMAGPGKLPCISRTILRVVTGERWSCDKKKEQPKPPQLVTNLYLLLIPPFARPKSQLLVCGPARSRFVPSISLRK